MVPGSGTHFQGSEASSGIARQFFLARFIWVYRRLGAVFRMSLIDRGRVETYLDAANSERRARCRMRLSAFRRRVPHKLDYEFMTPSNEL
jgi:hypothetical protein